MLSQQNRIELVTRPVLAQHRGLEQKWHAKKIKLHQRLALRLFQEDVKQVLDWLQNHGEVFLRKNVGIGRNLAKARAYQKSHQTFEGVVQNTYTNAEKLLAAAAELAQVLTSLGRQFHKKPLGTLPHFSLLLPVAVELPQYT